jgi:hypothetical protein
MPDDATLKRRPQLGGALLMILTDQQQQALPTIERQPSTAAQLIPLVAVAAAKVAKLGCLHHPVNELRRGRGIPWLGPAPGRAALQLAYLFLLRRAFLVAL